MAPNARHLSSTSFRPLTECNAGREEGDNGGGEGDWVDYSADPLTAFLGKFLPSSEEKSISPQAEDLVRQQTTFYSSLRHFRRFPLMS